MKSFFWIPCLLIGGLLTQAPAQAQRVFGVKAGGTFTHGATNIPAQPISTGLQIPEINNKNNGIGVGYSAGIWGRQDFGNIFLQAEVTYNRFVLKQKTDLTLDVNALAVLARQQLPVQIPNGLVTGTLHSDSESSLNSVNVPILIGKRFANQKVRVFAGPNFIFVAKAEGKQKITGQVNGNASIGVPTIPVSTERTTDLLSSDAGILQVKPFTVALEAGVGINPVPKLEVDLRYAVPVGGVYNDKGITGYLGIATLTVGYQLF